ncbi:MAG: hypothetical protein D6805_09010 [Planctomycetota bacterium]|nr:MAG: hypothetical protein D6805_09010 [Planctomycetota bacterium]
MRFRFLPIGIFLLLLPLPANASIFGVLNGLRLKGGVAWNDLESSLRYDKNNIDGTKIDLDTDLDMENNDLVPFFEILIGRKYKFLFGYMEANYKGKTTRYQPLVYDGLTLVSTTPKEVISRLQLRTMDFAFYYSIGRPTARVQMMGIIGGLYFRHKNRIFTSEAGSSNSEEAFIPYVGMELEFYLLRYLSISGRIRGLQYSWKISDVDELNYFEGEIGIGLHLGRAIGFYVQYRYRQLDLDKSSSSQRSEFASRLNGAVFSLILHF